ncbi:hypothetical protein I552_5268 [Mycobacterium xenopi 3993]|nr:hypothetical protein I552_5268 [Mycobacterium xenopi 3993]
MIRTPTTRLQPDQRPVEQATSSTHSAEFIHSRTAGRPRLPAG